MYRGWLAIVAILVAVGFSFAAESNQLRKEERWEQGRRFLAEGKAAEAKAAFEDLLTRYPNEPDLHLFLGIAYLRLRNPDAAEASIKNALAVDPDHVEARTLLAWIYSEIRRDFASAIREYTRVVELRPSIPEALNNLGVALEKNGELEKAAATFTKALEQRPDYSTALTNRGWVFANQGRWDEARRDFEQALKYNSKDDGALYGLSQALREKRDYAGAQGALRQLISRSPNFVYWLEWGRVGLIRYYWVFVLIAILCLVRVRFLKARNVANGG